MTLRHKARAKSVKAKTGVVVKTAKGAKSTAGRRKTARVSKKF